MSKRTVPKKRRVFMRDSDGESNHSGFELDQRQKKSIKYQGEKRGHWNETQRARYFLFIDSNKKSLQTQVHGKAGAIYGKMSKFVETRTPCQCKSHHQKMLKKYGSIDAIIQSQKQDKSTKISFPLRTNFKLDQSEIFSDIQDVLHLPVVFSTSKKDLFMNQQPQNVISIQKSQEFGEVQFFHGNQSEPYSPQLIRSINYSIRSDADPIFTFQ